MRVARDVMQTYVVTLSPETPLHSAQRVFYEEGIHGAPVVTEEGRLVGILSSMDILRAAIEDREGGPFEPTRFRNDLDLSQVDWESAPASLERRLIETCVSDAMSPDVISVPPDAPVSEIARLLRLNRVHRIVVAEGEKLCGLISTFDLVGLLEDAASEG